MPLAYRELHRFHANHRSVFDRSLSRALGEWSGDAPEAAGGFLMGSEIARVDALAVISALLGYFRSLRLAIDEPVEFRAGHADSLWPLIACLLLGARPVMDGTGTARIAISDRPGQGRWAHELCVRDAEAQASLAKVLSAYPEPGSGFDAGLGADADGSTATWKQLLGVDGLGRLRRSPAGPRGTR
jgi:hypothetical protein